jgi:HD-GYP domain-containing protein (c-di-GMP phosphodiesterase class II)
VNSSETIEVYPVQPPMVGTKGDSMTETHALLERIRDLRERLDQVRGIVSEAHRTATSLLEPEADGNLEERLVEGERRQALLEASIQRLTAQAADEEIRPTRLIQKVRRQLERGRELVAQLKALADEPIVAAEDPDGVDGENPLWFAHREVATMTESALRLVQAFPDSPSAQLRLGEGLESLMDSVADRLATLTAAVEARKAEMGRRTVLARILRAIYNGDPFDASELTILIDYLLNEVKQGQPLRFVSVSAKKSEEFIAAHSLMVARVVARMIRHDQDLWNAASDVVAAAILKDVGMLSVSSEILAQPGPLNDDQKRQIEGHCRVSADLIADRLPAAAPLCEAIRSHHERLDGTGYPAGLRGGQISPLGRLLAVADVYAAMCCARPHRPALDPRTAMTETLLMADRGQLDRGSAERLLQLAFYPVGTIVELADGTVGVVVANHLTSAERRNPARPVVAILADSRGNYLPTPRHVDLAECDSRSVTRTLPSVQRRRLLGSRYPHLV